MVEYDRIAQNDENDSLHFDEQSPVQTASLEPLELEQDGLHQCPPTRKRRITDPVWLLSVAITFFLVLPTLTSAIYLVFSLIGRIWPSSLFSLHLTLALWAARDRIPTEAEDGSLQYFSVLRRHMPPLIDAALFRFVYVVFFDGLVEDHFTDIDGTPVIEWQTYRQRALGIETAGSIISAGRIVQEATFLCLYCYHQLSGHNRVDDRRLLVPSLLSSILVKLGSRGDIIVSERRRIYLCSSIRRMFAILSLISLGIFVWCIESMLVHCVSWPAPVQTSAFCDALDTTECFLPFPSFHHMVRDSSSHTGWRVNLRGDVMPPLKGGLEMHPSFLNELDGFSTMAPLMFYMEGMKEADAVGRSDIRLQGAQNIALSVTDRSITLLVDVKAQTLVPHTAEIDHIDPKRPLVLVFPAQPLSHNRHYALAVVHATDLHGIRLPPTKGLQSLGLVHDGRMKDENDRRSRYKTDVVPSLLEAAPWLDYGNDPDLLQMLFDFQTVSEESQLGPIRSVRDGTLEYIESSRWGKWEDRVRVVQQNDRGCWNRDRPLARTIHGELDVPWFLEEFGAGQRGAFLDASAVSRKEPVSVGKVKFIVHIPCSVRDAAIQSDHGMPLSCILEYGHALFASRRGAGRTSLVRLADEKGCIIVAMDWRGMSHYDLLVVAETLMSKPRNFQFVRDNLIQGYASKLALHHFARNGMLDLPWCKFQSQSGELRPIPLFGGSQPSHSFYGVSQGGILGAGYTALSGATGLIDRAALGSPGTPFALILTRSVAFRSYDSILLLNFYNNRHVRVVLALVQMAWDSTEGSGLLATPVTEPVPPTLIQAGLGDATVPTIAAEALARAFGASVLEHNPRTNIYGIPVGNGANATYGGPRAALTELLYKHEYQNLPIGDELPPGNNAHSCVRQDPHLIQQLAEFISTGRVIDPCLVDGCVRQRVHCGQAY